LENGLLKPKKQILGFDIAGKIEAVGKNVELFKPGDEVYGDLSDHGFGAYAEYVSAPESELAHKPVNLTFEEAAATAQAAVVALQGLRKGGIQSGQHVLVVGASGGIGTFAVQIAKSYGAEVTGVCSTANIDLVKSLGADQVIDYTQVDFARNGTPYDLILATAGYRSIYDYKRSLGSNGVYIVTGGSMSQIFQGMAGPLVTMGSSKRMENLSAKSKQEDLIFVKELIEAGKVKPVIDRKYSLAEVPEAFRYYEQGRTRGKIVINIAE
jgi:NADPH:quinone reductase-like Zn-dependent oxidoreductase